MILPEVAELLEAEARRINAPEFVAADPVQFPRQFSALPDIEIAAFLSATIAWGNRQDDLQQLQQNAAADGLSAISICDGLRL